MTDITREQVDEIEVIIREIRSAQSDLEGSERLRYDLGRQIEQLKSRANEIIGTVSDPVRSAELRRRVARDRYLLAVKAQERAESDLDEASRALLALQDGVVS